MARPTGVPSAVGSASGSQQQPGCTCGNGPGMKPVPGTTPPGQPPTGMRPNDAIPYPGSPGMRPYTGTMPQIMPESRPYPAGVRSLFTPQTQQQPQSMASLFDMIQGRMF